MVSNLSNETKILISILIIIILFLFYNNYVDHFGATPPINNQQARAQAQAQARAQAQAQTRAREAIHTNQQYIRDQQASDNLYKLGHLSTQLKLISTFIDKKYIIDNKTNFLSLSENYMTTLIQIYQIFDQIQQINFHLIQIDNEKHLESINSENDPQSYISISQAQFKYFIQANKESINIIQDNIVNFGASFNKISNSSKLPPLISRCKQYSVSILDLINKILSM